MGKTVRPKIKILPKNFDRDAEAILARIQPELLPDNADKTVSINVSTGEYVMADTPREATRKFKERWPDELSYQVRADGGPVVKLSWTLGNETHSSHQSNWLQGGPRVVVDCRYGV